MAVRAATNRGGYVLCGCDKGELQGAGFFLGHCVLGGRDYNLVAAGDGLLGGRKSGYGGSWICLKTLCILHISEHLFFEKSSLNECFLCS